MRDLQLLKLLHLFDSQLPIGAFALSGGLETYAQEGAGLDQLRALVTNQIALGWGRAELATACLAWRAAGGIDRTSQIDRLAARADAMKPLPATRDASRRLGARLLALLRRLYPVAVASLDPKPSHHAVVAGAAARLLDLPERELLLALGQSLLSGAVAAATRCMPVSPAQAQGLIVEMQPHLARAVARAVTDPEEAMFTCTPALDIRCDQQGRLHTRLFQS